MPENDFEKEVQQLFDGFKLKPTAEVWTKVHTRIRNDKRKRRYILWLPLLLLMLGAGSYWMAVNKNSLLIAEPLVKNSENTTSSTEKNTKEAFEIPDDESRNAGLPAQKINNKGLSAKGGENQYNSNKIIKDGLGSDLPLSAELVAGRKQLANNNAPDLNIENASTTHPAPVVAHIQKPSISFELSKNNDNNLIQKDGEINELLISDRTTASVHNYSISGVPQKVVVRSGIPINVEAVKYISRLTLSSGPVVKLGKKKLWEFGIEGGVGVTKMGNGIAELLSLRSDVDKSMAPNNMGLVNSGSNISNLAGRNNIYVMALAPSASSVEPGMAWHLGIFTKWHFKDRISLSTGLQYNYLSTHRQVGKIFYPNSFNNQNLSTPSYSACYPGDETIDYTNKYHYITMPVGLQWQLNKGNKLPVELNVGADLSWMTTTNALHYNGNTGSYFEDKGRFNKFQAGISTGLSVRLFQHNKHPLDIGPVFQYNITNLLKKGYDNNQNIIYGGINARLVLWKK